MESLKNEKAGGTATVEKSTDPSASQSIQSVQKSPSLLNAGTVTVCAIPAALAAEAVIASIYQSAVIGAPWAAIPFAQPLRARAIFTYRHVDERAWRAIVGEAAFNPEVKPLPPLRLANAAGLSILVPEGQALLRQKLLPKKSDPANAPELFVIGVSWPPSGHESALAGFARLVDLLREAQVAVILVLSGCQDSASLRNVAAIDEFLHVQVCEPDPDALLAFRVDAEMCSMLWLACPEPQLLSLLKTGTARWRQELFLASDPMSRQIIRMRQKNMTLEEIGQKLSVDKSTIQRRLSKLGVVKPLSGD